jgi:TIR domain
MGKRVFVSYSRRDGDVIETLVNDLRSLGHDPWVDRLLVGGQVWWDAVLQNIERCDVFVIGISPDMINSTACEAEYRYASALAKPILPVTVRGGVADELLPQALGAVQRVNYTTQDKQAFAALLSGLGSLPDAPPLPTTMPIRPAVPMTYLYDLKQEIDSPNPLDAEKQAQIITQLTARMRDGSDPAAMNELLDHLQRRDDLLVRTAQQIGEMRAALERQVGASAFVGEPTTSPAPQATGYMPPPPQPQQAAAAQQFAQPQPAQSQHGQAQPQYVQPPPPLPVAPQYAPMPPRADSQKVSGAWWIAPIFFGILGGLIAWAVNRERSPSTARTMLIVGAVCSVVWFAVLASNGSSS